MRRETAGIVWLLFIVVMALHSVAYGMDEAYDYLAGSVHLDSDISGGNMKIEELVQVAKEQGSQVVIITDNDNKWVTYGIWPFRNLIRYTRGKRRIDGTPSPGIKKYGSERYIKEIESAGKRHEIIAIHGIEAVPYYQWEGKGILWRKPSTQQNEKTSKGRIDLRLKDWHRHLLVIGLKNAEEYEKLPSIGNNTYSLQYNFKGILNLWPTLLVIVGIWRFRSSKKKIRRGIIAGILIVIGLVGVWGNSPFFPRKHNPYHDSGETPYQDVINYVNEKEGMVFWAHPEGGRGAENFEVPIPSVVQPLATLLGINRELIEVQTDSYEELLNKTDGYTGFAIFVKGMTKIGRSDGLWDKLLQAYCNGKRERPIWAIGETDFEGGGPPEWVRDTQTIFLIKKAPLSASERRERVLEAMRQGRMYAKLESILDQILIRLASTFALGTPVDKSLEWEKR